MKIKIIGLNDKRIIFALEKLMKAFNRENSICDSNYDIKVYVNVITFQTKLKVIIKDDNTYIEKTSEMISDVDSDIKYLVLVCFYQLLSKLTNKKLSYGVLTGIRPTKLIHHYKDELSDQEIIKLMQSKYCVTQEKANLLLDVANYQLDVIDFKEIMKEVSIYINIPFCLSRCTYCSFTSFPYNDLVSENYLNVLFKEIKTLGNYLLNNNISITSIYVGGGTPTAINSKELKSLLDTIEKYLLFKEVREFTLECGRVDSLNYEKLQIIKDSQVTRISINPQTFNEKTLINVNRKHSIKEIYEKYQLARDIGLNNINMDLIIGLPQESLEDIKHSINETLALKPESITIHYLAQKKGSQLFNEQLNNQEDFYFTAFDYAFKCMKNNGYLPYYLYRQKNITGNLENIGYCLKEFESIYNIIMIDEKQTILGLGSGASSKFLNYELILNPRDIKSYINSYKTYLEKKIKCLEKTLLMKEVL